MTDRPTLIMTEFKWVSAYDWPERTGFVAVDPTEPMGALEELFGEYNHGSPYEVPFDGPSMSVGDTVTLGETTWRCASRGWEVVR